MELHVKGLTYQVDDDCAEMVGRHSWSLVSNRTGDFYLTAWIDGRTVSLHRLIMGEPPGAQVDHRNGNVRDNRRANLRVCTPAENRRNSRRYSNNQCGYKGVTRSKTKSPRWRATIVFEKKQIRLGSFGTPEEAHEAYRTAAVRLFGEFARFE